MRRVFGAMAFVVGASLLVSATALAEDLEGRVVNAKPKRPVKRLVDPAPAEPTPAEATPKESTPTEATPTEATPTEATPSEPTPTEATRSRASMSDADQATEEATGVEPTLITPGNVTRTHEEIQVTEEEKRRAAAGKQAAAAEEMQMMGRIRGLQTLVAKEEQLLSQRLAYAAKLREKGLATNDEKILAQAEQFERAALAEYLKKIQQFERASVTNSAADPSRQATQPPSRASKGPSSTPRR